MERDSRRSYHMAMMDNAAFDGNGEVAVRAGNGRGPRGVATATVELGEFAPTTRAPPRSSVPQVVIVGGVMPVGAAPLPLCKPDLCRSMTSAQAAGKPTAMRPNPWHRHKTVLLVGTVVGLVVWALAYLLLQYYKVLE